MSDPFVAEVRIVPFNFAPSGWAFCDGQLLPLVQNSALFSILSTFYGGNGQSTFALPNLQGRVVMGAGAGPGLTERIMGESGGSAEVSLLVSEIPSHAHALRANTTTPADINEPGAQSVLAVATGGTPYETANQSQLAATAVGFRGEGMPHNNMQPYLTMNFIISLGGVFPG